MVTRDRNDPDWTDQEAEGMPGLDSQPPGVDAETAGEGSFPPHDYALGVKGYGVTAEEQAFGEPLDMRLGRERPDQPTEDEYGGDNEGEPSRNLRIGQGASDIEGGEIEEHPEGLSAEEQAMHVIGEGSR